MADEQELNSNQVEPEQEDAKVKARKGTATAENAKLDMDERKRIGAEVDREYEGWRTPRRPHELQWFINAAYRRGKQTTETIQSIQTVQDLTKLDRRKKNIANKLWAKGRARFAKFAKTRPKPIVIPFTSERKARLDARATERALDYFYEKGDQEQKYLDVILFAQDMGKAYWWLHWNDKANATLQQKDKITGTINIEDFEGGDVELEVGSAFEVLVPDLRRFHLKDQDKMMRVRTMDVEEMKARYPDFADSIKADSHLTSPFEFERQIAHLSGSEAGALASMSSDMKGPMTGVLVKEEYTKPNSKYPDGRMVVVCNGIAVKVQEELPHGFADMENPYPVVEFADMPQVGQFYSMTFIEQLIPIQRGYNMLRDKLEAQIRLNTHPKWIVPRQARVPKGSLTNEAGEVVEWNYIPGMPEPHTVTPGSVVADAWRFAQLLNKEFDDISQVQPTIEGKAGGSKSGLQTQLLQEASDSVHSPDARGFELAVRDASYKIRRMMKRGYSVPRLLSFNGPANIPQVFEFSGENIDEHAQIVVQVGSALSQFKATKIQQLMELHEKGLLGDPNDPELKRRVLGMLDIGGLEKFQEEARQDEDMARSENMDLLEGKHLPVPLFYEDHIAHYGAHTDELKSPANKDMPVEMKKELIMHVLLHMKWINPVAAFELANELKLTELITSGLIKPPTPQTGPPTPQGGGPQGPSPVAGPGPNTNPVR